MFRVRLTAIPLLGFFLAISSAAVAQRHGGRGAGSPGVSSRPDGVQDKDPLKDFHRAMAVQATGQQIAEFQRLLQSTEAAKAAVEANLRKADKANPAAPSEAGMAQLDQALQTARNASRKFVEGFSATQKSGLKDAVKKLEKADSALEDVRQKLDQSLQTAGRTPEAASRLNSLDKSLTEFSNQQLAVGREMGITLANGQDLTFNLPTVNRAVHSGGSPVEVAVSGALSQTAVQGSQRAFRIEITADLSDLQRNITEFLRPQIERANPCGERLALRRADLTPSSPATILQLRLHYERWTCMGRSGQSGASELAESDGAVEMKLVAALDPASALSLTATFGRIDAAGLMAEAIRSGDLGDDLRDNVAQSLLSALRSAMELKSVLPPAVQASVALQTAKFQPIGVGNVSLLLQGQVHLSDEQASLLARQLNQTLSAQGPVPQSGQP